MEKGNDVPYIVFESVTTRMERTIARLWVALIISLFFLVATNLSWIFYEMQFEDIVTTTTVSQNVNTNSGNAAINDGVHVNDTSKSNSNNNN